MKKIILITCLLMVVICLFSCKSKNGMTIYGEEIHAGVNGRTFIYYNTNVTIKDGEIKLHNPEFWLTIKGVYFYPSDGTYYNQLAFIGKGSYILVLF